MWKQSGCARGIVLKTSQGLPSSCLLDNQANKHQVKHTASKPIYHPVNWQRMTQLANQPIDQSVNPTNSQPVKSASHRIIKQSTKKQPLGEQANQSSTHRLPANQISSWSNNKSINQPAKKKLPVVQQTYQLSKKNYQLSKKATSCPSNKITSCPTNKPVVQQNSHSAS